MSHPIYRIVSFDAVGADTRWRRYAAHCLRRRHRAKDRFSPVLSGELYARLRDLALFNAVEIDPEVHALVWPNGADFDPATLHDWPEYVDALTQRARCWSLTPA